MKWIENLSQREYLKAEEFVAPGIYREEEWVAVEINLMITINGKELVRFACSPVDCKDLAIGFLFTKEIISCFGDIDSLIHNKTENTVKFRLNDKIKFNHSVWQAAQTFKSAYEKGTSLKIDFKAIHDPKSLSQLFYHLQSHSQWYEKTGCIHQVSLFNNDGTVITREDIGRHNALYKVMGAALQSNINFENTILSCSARLSADIILSAVRAKIPVVVSRAAPTSRAIDIAEEFGITLIGFARGKRMNIYTHPERVSLTEQMTEMIPEINGGNKKKFL